MARINLLPWREQLRKEREVQFYITMGVAAFVVLALLAYIHMRIATQMEVQQARNQFLEQQIVKVDAAISEIRSLEEEKARLLARMNVIQELQRSRPAIVHLFEELVLTLPEGARLLKATHKGKVLDLEGLAESNARVSAFMRNLDRSAWLANPELVVINSSMKEYPNASWFNLTVVPVDPTVKNDSQGGGQ